MMEYESYDNILGAIADTPEEAANLTARSDIMQKLVEIIKAGGWTQAEAAKYCHISQPRENDLLRGDVRGSMPIAGTVTFSVVCWTVRRNY
jgi:predicted XRE-type DNA-binding protein